MQTRLATDTRHHARQRAAVHASRRLVEPAHAVADSAATDDLHEAIGRLEHLLQQQREEFATTVADLRAQVNLLRDEYKRAEVRTEDLLVILKETVVGVRH